NAYSPARLLAFMHPFHDAGGSGYQNAQALIALGSGGIWGKGLGQGTQKLAYLPESPSDMIAAVIGEELGLIGILLTALAFAGFAVLGFRIALRARDPFAKYLAAGITCLVTGQAVVNLGAVLGFLPVTGLPRKPSPALVRGLGLAGLAPARCARILHDVRPDVVFGGGGYVAGPMLAAAGMLRIPAALLEVDAHLGLANRLGAPFARRV